MDRGAPDIKFFKFLAVIVDVLVICLSFFAAVQLRKLSAPIDEANIRAVLISLPYICLASVALLYVYGMYSVLTRTANEIILSVGLVAALGTVITMAVTFFLREFTFPRSVIFMGGLIQFVVMSALRYAELVVRRAVHGRQTLLVVGRDYEVREAVHKIILSSSQLYRVKFFIELRDSLLKVKQLMRQVDHVVICSDVSEHDKAAIFSFGMELNVNVFLVPKLFDISIKNSALYQFDDMPTFMIGRLALTDEQKLMKRLFDIVLSACATVAALPVMLAVAAAIKLTSPGPVFFVQERVTEKNKQYKMYKFRTMIDNAEELTGPVLASEHDPRVTKIGEFLRNTRLDELPQLFNVLRGDMSLVGPRAERMFFIDQFKQDLPEFEYRISVKAGVTGLAQVLGKYTTTPSDKLVYDLLYIRNYSYLLDLQILFQTVKIALTGFRALRQYEGRTLETTVDGQGYKILKIENYYQIVNK